MNKNIEFKRITTNNLKNIDISIQKNKITVLCGVNGSGKTSLAYDTIEKISHYEYSKISGGVLEENDFKVESYSNITPTVSLKQLNHNNNPKSTIATYTGIDRYFKQLFSTYHNLPFSFFSFHKYSSACPSCNGLGYELISDIDLIVDFERSLNEQPFKTWNSYVGNHYQELLIAFATDENINLDIPIKNLTQIDINKILYAKGDKSFKIKFKQKQSYKNKVYSYLGPVQEVNEFIVSTMVSDNVKAKSYVKQVECRNCQGKRFSEKINKLKIKNYSIADLYLLEIKDLPEALNSMLEINNIAHVIMQLLSILTIYNDSNIDYLHLNRAVPSLSGGELQRLRLSTILTSKISNVLYILDEPSSSIYHKELPQLFNQISNLKQNGNTVLLIEHNQTFIEQSDCKIILGPGAGSEGGYVIDNIIKQDEYNRKKISQGDYLILKNLNFNNIKNETLKYPTNVLIGISGPSGSGKTSLAKSLNKKIDNCIYISQKPISGNINSIVCSYIEIFDSIKNEFLKSNIGLTKQDISFSNINGACASCNGNGYLYIQIPFGDKIKNICSECNGNRFNKNALSYKIKEFNILDILKMPINKLLDLQLFKSKKINEKLTFLESIGLGYINLFQGTSTLSGGESQRLKLVKNLYYNKKNYTYIIDEPFCGVDKTNIGKTLFLFDKIINNSSTIFIIEHNTFALSQCDYLIEVGPGKGNEGGKIVNTVYNK